MAISKQIIIEAAEALLAEGVNPTIAAVRARLGSGSFATISPVLREWRLSREKQANASIQMPDEARASLDRLGGELWRALSELATREMAQLKNDADERVDEAHGERDEALAEIERLESEVAEAGTKATEMEHRLTQREQLCDRLQQDNRALAIENAKLEERIKASEETAQRLRLELEQAHERERALVQALPRQPRSEGGKGKGGGT